MIDHLPAWVLEESVDVTLVHSDPDSICSIYLVEHIASINCEHPDDQRAITITFDDTRVLLNGVFVDLGDDLMSVCSLVDDVREGLGGHDDPPALGVTRRSDPYTDEPAGLQDGPCGDWK